MSEARRLRVAFLGNDARSVPSLDALAASAHDVVAVVTAVPRPAGRGNELTPTPVATRGRELGLRVEEVESVRTGNGFKVLAQAAPEILVVVAYGELLSPDVLDIPRLGSLNVHFSVLPRWRGAAPVQRAILEGDERTGVTVMLMDEGMDTGPILASEETPVDPEEDAGTLGSRLSEMGATLLVDTLRALEAGTIEPRSQDHPAATYAPKLTRDDRTIDWAVPSGAIVRRVRAMSPDPGATTLFRGDPLKILRARDRGAHGHLLSFVEHEPGAASLTDEGGVLVHAIGHTIVEILEVAPAGRKRMSAAEWARGARLQAGERFG